MLCGVKFCGGCNPRFQRADALDTVRQHFAGRIGFEYAEEDKVYDLLLVIGGCTNCCASHGQYDVKQFFVKMWDQKHIRDIIKKFETVLQESEKPQQENEKEQYIQGGKTFELERGL